MNGHSRYDSGPDHDQLVRSMNDLLEREGALSSDGFDLEVKRSERASLADTYILTVRFSQGGFRRFSMKDFGHTEHLGHDPGSRHDCELGVYRDLLGQAGLGTARYLGSRWSDAGGLDGGADGGADGGPRWLFLEYVPGTDLRYCGMPAWHAAARWLGRMQGAFAGRMELLRRAAFLDRHDPAFFERTATRALEAVREAQPAIEPRVARVVERYRAVHGFMADHEPTLVHGAYHPQNLLVRQGSEPPSICPTGWGLAAVGSRLYDFGCFTHGVESRELGRLWDSYREGAREAGFEAGKLAAARPMLDCVRLHRIVQLLAFSMRQRADAATVEGLVTLGESLSQPQLA